MTKLDPETPRLTRRRELAQLASERNGVFTALAARAVGMSSSSLVVQHEGFRATSLARSIVDSARAHTGPEQIVMAVREALRRGLLNRRDLERAMKNASARVRDLIQEGQST